jgi:hypothetical protein
MKSKRDVWAAIVPLMETCQFWHLCPALTHVNPPKRLKLAVGKDIDKLLHYQTKLLGNRFNAVEINLLFPFAYFTDGSSPRVALAQQLASGRKVSLKLLKEINAKSYIPKN